MYVVGNGLNVGDLVGLDVVDFVGMGVVKNMVGVFEGGDVGVFVVFVALPICKSLLLLFIVAALFGHAGTPFGEPLFSANIVAPYPSARLFSKSH